MLGECYTFGPKVLEIIATRVSYLGRRRERVVVGIAGRSASGKGYITKVVSSRLNDIAILSMDNYYISRTRLHSGNFDEPAAVELKLFSEHLARLRAGLAIHRPVFNFPTASRLVGRYNFVLPKSILWVDGIFSLHDTIKAHIDLALFVEASAEVCLERRIARDKAEGRNLLDNNENRYWHDFVEPGYKKYIEPCKKDADIVIFNNDYHP